MLSHTQFSQSGMRGLTAMEVASEMAPGLNLFNTLDAVCWWCDDCSNGLESEIVWGNPYTTPEMVQGIADRGFKSLRIPVTWFNHMGPSPDFLIDTAWMDRVEEVVNYALDANLYAIINIHHDDYNEDHPGSWLCPTFEKQGAVTDQLVKVWTQIAERFKDYSDSLIFETMNEPREVGSPEEWSGGSAEHRDVINAFNLAAVNAIRATGSNNETRFIMIPQVGANGNGLEDMIIPNDDPNIMISVHNYSPYDFCINSEGTARWGTSAEIESLQNEIKVYSDYSVENGIPVILGEWGAGNKDNYGDRIIYYDVFTNACKDQGITPIAWIYGFNRRTLTWEYPLVEDAILYAYDSTVVDVETIELNVTSDTLYYGDSLQLTADVLPETATSQTVVWTTHDSKKATVSQTGLVNATAAGHVKIVASTIGKTAICNLFIIDTLVHTNIHVEAEDYYFQSGTENESCFDENGSQNISQIENGDNATYIIKIDTSGIYDFAARAATANDGGTIEIKANEALLGSLTVDGSFSNGWQDWFTTQSTEIAIEKGGYFLKLTFKGGSGNLFNLNWFKLDFNRPLNVSSVKNDLTYIAEYNLNQNYPNPFNPSTKIHYSIPEQSQVELKVFDVLGREVSVLVNEEQPQGNYKVEFDASDLNSGVYFYQLRSGSFVETKKMLLLK